MIKSRLAKLIDVKSIVTLMFTIAFMYLAVSGIVSAGQFTEIYLMIVGFYFGTQARKKEEKGQ